MPMSFRLLGLVAIIPASLLLTVSFFVLLTIGREKTKGLKAFGYVVVDLLWVATAIVISCGVYMIITGKHPMIQMMQQMMPMKHPMMQRPMMNR
jgi:hypothetical protein